MQAMMSCSIKIIMQRICSYLVYCTWDEASQLVIAAKEMGK
jgi:hypothetical protein